MIVKPFERREADVAELRRLAALPQVGRKTRTEIAREIRNIRAGDRAEQEVAYEIDFHFGASARRNHAVLHGLRIEVNGRVAQIDHLMINRLMECYVVEAKSFAGGIAINAHGEFTTFQGGRPVAVPSPVAQNERHIAVLREAEAAGLFDNPRRLGLPIRMSYRRVIAVGNRGRITRPEADVPGLERLIKADQFAQMYEKDLEAIGNPLQMAKVIGPETLEAFGSSIARQHRPITFDWAARFGIDPAGSADKTATLPAGAAPADTQAAPTQAPPARKPKAPPTCAVCRTEVDNKVAFFCRMNKARFGGRVLCREHQGTG